MKPKALVFFDLDGTLLNDRSEVESEVKQALAQMKEKGAVPFIATGRSPVEIHEIAEEAGISSFVSLNGQFVQYEGKEVSRNRLPEQSIKKLKETADKEGIPTSFYSASDFYVTKMSETVVNAYKFIDEEPPGVDPDFYQKAEILMALVITEDNSKDSLYIEQFPEFSFYRNTPYSMDVITKGHSKATGIDELVRKMDLEGVPLYAFGDGSNDIEMFKHVDVAIAMENGIEEVKQAADYITKSNLDAGIIQGLKQYDLI